MGFAADSNLALPIGLQKIIIPGNGVPSLEADVHMQMVSAERAGGKGWFLLDEQYLARR